MRKIEIIIRTISNNPVATDEKVVAELIAPENSVEIERNILNFPGLQIHLEYRRVFKNGQEIYLSRYEIPLQMICQSKKNFKIRNEADLRNIMVKFVPF